MKNSRTLWASCQTYIEQNVKPEDIDRLFAHVEFENYRVATKTLVLRVPSAYIAEEIEHTYLDVLRVAIYNTFGKIRLDWDIVIVDTPGRTGNATIEGNDDRTAPTQSITGRLAPGSPQPDKLPPIDPQLNPQQTFRTFIEGDANRLSRSVGISIAEHPGTTQFNPMFVFGPSGCGKTHLLNAIGNHTKKIYPDHRVLYVSARTFQMQFTNAMMNKQINDFIAFYQTVHLLLVDDIQEWASAAKTQDTFFHIFNHLIRNNRRIVLACDRPPAELNTMSKRLVTRFASGLLAEIERPNYELCRAILVKKISRDGVELPDDVIHYLASNATGSVRELEGVVNSLMAYAVVYNSPVDLRLVERVAGRAVRSEGSPVTTDDIINAVCQQYQQAPADVLGRSRKRDVALPRALIMFLAKKYTRLSTPRIGHLIGGRNHATVLHAYATIELRLNNDPDFAEQVLAIEAKLEE